MDLYDLFYIIRSYTLISFVIYCVICGLVTLAIGNAKGRNGFLYGFLLGILGIIIIACLPSRDESGYKCPHCGGIIEIGYSVCKHCGREILENQSNNKDSIDNTIYNDTCITSSKIKSIPEADFQSIVDYCHNNYIKYLFNFSYTKVDDNYVLQEGLSKDLVERIEKYLYKVDYIVDE